MRPSLDQRALRSMTHILSSPAFELCHRPRQHGCFTRGRNTPLMVGGTTMYYYVRILLHATTGLYLVTENVRKLDATSTRALDIALTVDQ